MALKDNETLTTVTSEAYVLLLEGKGIITNMSVFGKKLKFRYDTDIPANDAAARMLNGSFHESDKLSFVNDDEESKIYGIAANEDVKVLITKEVV